MKLKEIYNQVNKDGQDQPQINIEEVRQKFNEQISGFETMGENLYNLRNYKQMTEQLSNLIENAEHCLLSESDGWFDNITVRRNIKELKSYCTDFGKASQEAQMLQERLVALYEDMGIILNRYFTVGGGDNKNNSTIK